LPAADGDVREFCDVNMLSTVDIGEFDAVFHPGGAACPPPV
jgi:hypothetical protein